MKSKLLSKVSIAMPNGKISALDDANEYLRKSAGLED